MSCCCVVWFLFKWLAIIAIVLKLYLKLTSKWCRSQVCLVGKTAIVTGANTGIGFETALDFAKRGGKVIIACRTESKAKEACESIKSQTGNPNVTYGLIDMTSFASVRRFAAQIATNEERLDILVNNAGAGNLPIEKTEDGIVQIFQTNHFSSFLLTNLLSDLLKKTPNSRVVNVSSMAGKRAAFDLGVLESYPGHLMAYSQTKLWNILFTRELAQKLKGTSVTVYSLHPGVIATDFFRNLPAWAKFLVDGVAKHLIKSPVEGAQTQIWAAISQNIEDKSGAHFHECGTIKTYKSVDGGFAKKLWEKSEGVVGLQSTDPKF